MVEVFTEALRETRTWFRNALKEKLVKEHSEYVMFSFYWELQVCHLIIIWCFPIA